MSFDDWGLPRSTGDLGADRSAALLAERTASTAAQRAAVALRLADIRAREVRGAKSQTAGREGRSAAVDDLTALFARSER